MTIVHHNNVVGLPQDNPAAFCAGLIPLKHAAPVAGHIVVHDRHLLRLDHSQAAAAALGMHEPQILAELVVGHGGAVGMAEQRAAAQTALRLPAAVGGVAHELIVAHFGIRTGLHEKPAAFADTDQAGAHSSVLLEDVVSDDQTWRLDQHTGRHPEPSAEDAALAMFWRRVLPWISTPAGGD